MPGWHRMPTKRSIIWPSFRMKLMRFIGWTGQNQDFENDDDAHYQWIIIPEDEDENGIANGNGIDVDDQVAFEDIMIGFRHSYGGYHRILKQYRKAGVDPALQAAQQQAEQQIAAAHAGGTSPISSPHSHSQNNANN